MFPVALDEVNVTAPPEQNVVGPLAPIIGVAGVEFTATDVALEEVEQEPFETLTV